MTNSILDNELSSFLRAASVQGDGELTASSEVGLRRFIDPLKLQERLDRTRGLRMDKAQEEYLVATKMFESLEFLDRPLPKAKVLAKGDQVRVRVEGPLSALALWEVPISIDMHELYVSGLIQEYGLDGSALFTEQVRRMQVKGDLLRNSGVRFVEGGCRYRSSWTVYSWLVPTLMGDMPDLLTGTTNLAMALFHGLPPVSLDSDFPGGLTDLNSFDRIRIGSVEGVSKALSEATDSTLVVHGVNAYEMAHLHSHFGDAVLFEWGADLTADAGPVGARLPLSITTREK